MRLLKIIVLVVVMCSAPSFTANILAAIWFPGKSHFIMYERLLKALATRGHNVTVVSHFPQKKPLANYHDISLVGSLPIFVNNITVDQISKEIRNDVPGIWMAWKKMADLCRQMYAHPDVHQLARSPDHYDLVIVELFFTDCMAAFAHKFQAPLVGITSSNAMPWTNQRVGNPDNPAYSQPFFATAVPPFSFRERLVNAFCYVSARLGNWYLSELEVDDIVREVFGEGVPPTPELMKGSSLVLANSHWSVDQALPTAPAFVEVGGLHIQEPKPLEKDLKKFIEGSPEGVIFFSLGSMIRCDTFSADKLQAILDVFKQLPQRVLWKVDPATLPPLPANVKADTWFPQNDILNHPKVKVFITHGGLMGKLEAVQAGVPMLVIPFFADQFSNAAKSVAKGSALQLLYEDITYESLRDALNALLNDNRYRERARQLSALFRDRPRPPMEEAIYWVEYVLRHRGARHLRSAALDLTWYQYLLLDVAAFVVAVSGLVLFAAYKIIVLTRPKGERTQKVKMN